MSVNFEQVCASCGQTRNRHYTIANNKKVCYGTGFSEFKPSDYWTVYDDEDGTVLAHGTLAEIEQVPDRCQTCHGKRGGMLGNENIINGAMMCDYCTSDWLAKERSQQ